MRQTINIIAFLISGFAVGYCVGLNPQVDSARNREKETFTARVSAYCQKSCCCGDFADGITASGHKIKPGEKFVAADRRFAFDTMLTIPGYNEGRPVPVLDRGGTIKGDKLDVFFDDENGKSGHQRAREWGVKTLRVEIRR